MYSIRRFGKFRRSRVGSSQKTSHSSTRNPTSARKMGKDHSFRGQIFRLMYSFIFFVIETFRTSLIY